MTTTIQEKPAAAKKKAPAKKAATAKAEPSRAVAVQPEPTNLLQMCAAAARDPGVDVAKLRELLEMANRQEDRRLEEERRKAEREFNVAMLAAQSEIHANKVIKRAYNDHTRSHYVKLENLAAVVDPIAHKHGFTLSYGMGQSDREDHYRITCDVAHTSGSSRQFFADIGTDVVGAKGGGTKSGAQGSGSSISYGRRYLKCMIFDVVPVGEDDDGAGGKSAFITKAQLKQLRDELKAGGPDPVRFNARFEIESLAELPAEQFDAAVKKIAEYKRLAAAKAAEKAKGAAEGGE